MVIEKIAYLDEEKQNKMEKTKRTLYSIGLDKLYKENLDLVAYELSMRDYFSKIIRMLELNSGYSLFTQEEKGSVTLIINKWYLFSIRNVELKFTFDANNRILIEVSTGNKDLKKVIRSITICPLSSGDETCSLYYDSEIVEIIDINKHSNPNKLKKTVRHLVRQNGKCIMTTVPEYEELGKAYTKK